MTKYTRKDVIDRYFKYCVNWASWEDSYTLLCILSKKDKGTEKEKALKEACTHTLNKRDKTLVASLKKYVIISN